MWLYIWFGSKTFIKTIANDLVVRCCFLLGLVSSEICLTCELSKTTKDFNQEEREGYLERRA